MNRRFKGGFLLQAIVTMLVVATSAHADSPQAAVDDRALQAPEVRFMADRVSLPFTLVRFFPFVDANINGTAGRLLLDTGSLPALSLNDHRLVLSGSKPLGSGSYGSGQHFETHINEQVRNVRIAGMHFPAVSHVESHDSSQLERITPDFIGWLGYSAFQGYAMKLDYDRLTATFYRGDLRDELAQETILGRIRTRDTRRPGVPVTSGLLGDVPMDALFDTGQNAALFLDKETKRHLIKTGALTAEPGGTFTVRHLSVDGWPVPPIEHLDVSDAPAPFNQAFGLKGPNVISLGYALLRQHPTLWDFEGNTIYVLKNR